MLAFLACARTPPLPSTVSARDAEVCSFNADSATECGRMSCTVELAGQLDKLYDRRVYLAGHAYKIVSLSREFEACLLAESRSLDNAL
jgi:hypothetical protein